MPHNGPRPIVRSCARWLGDRRVTLFSLIVLAWWVIPLTHPRGSYAGCYRVFDLEVGILAALVALVSAAVAAAPPRMRRALAMRLGVALGALVLTAAVCDVGYVAWTVQGRHFWYYGQEFPHEAHEHDPELIWKFRPGFAYQGRANPFSHNVRFDTDEHGFRNPRGITQADVVFVGDSVTMAAEVPEEATFVRKTAQALGTNAVNLGLFGYGPQQELVVLKRFGLAYHPRTVVWQVTEWNDCEDAERYAKREHPDKPQLKPWTELYETYSPIVAGLARIFHRRGTKYDDKLVLFRRSDGLVDSRYLWPDADELAKSPRGWEETKRAIGEAHALCREQGIRFVVLFVPSHTRVLSHYVLPRTPDERDRFAPPGGEHPSPLTVALADFCRQLGCPMIDLFPAFRRRGDADNAHLYIKHDPHLDLDGHDEAALALVQCLREQKDFTAQIAEGKAEEARRK
ncbi:MAG: hypothetical protein P4L84_05255 [Isosphaeraceae bacterium]|nr:hypothetical protein [Isosphaeraceae bacterium]